LLRFFPAALLTDYKAAMKVRNFSLNWRRILGNGQCRPGRYGLALLMCLLIGANLPMAHSAEPDDEPVYAIDIPALNAAEALNRLADQTGAVFLFPYDLAAGRQANAVVGRYTLMDALGKLLRGSGLSGGLSDKHAIQISLVEGRELPNEDGPVAHNQQNNSSFFQRLSAALVVAFSANTANTWAQDEAGSSALEEVLVTARKREESIADVPIAITALTDQNIIDMSARKIGDFLQVAPGVNSIDGGTGIVSVAIRGVSTDLGGSANGYYVDEVPFTGVTTPIYPDLRAFDIERVEILRGPQGTLFGDGSMGGTIRFLTNQPDTSAFAGHVNTFFSSTSGGDTGYGIRGMANIPIVEDMLAIRAVYITDDEGGWIEQPGVAKDVNSKEVDTYRIKALFTPVETLEFYVSAWKYEGDFYGNDALDDGTIPSGALFLSTEADQITAGMNWQVGPGELTYAYGDMSWFSPVVTEIPGLGFLDAGIDIEVETHELRYAAELNDRWAFTTGAYARDAGRFDNIVLTVPGLPFPLIDNRRTDDFSAYALFGEVEYQFTEQWSAAFGLRYFNEDFDTVDSDLPADFPGTSGSGDSWNPRYILRYKPTENSMYYASAAKGYRSPQVQAGAAILIGQLLGIELPISIPSDTIWTYELGYKGFFADGKLSLEGAVYSSKWDGRVIRVDLASTGINGLSSSDGTDMLGGELSITYSPIDSLLLQAGLSYIDGEYRSAVPGTPIQEGDPIDGVSEWSGSASATWRHDLGNEYNLFAFLGSQFYSERENTSFALNTPGDDILLANARFGVEKGAWGAYLFADNLLDEDGALTFRSGSAGGTAPRARPFTVGVELDFHF
jgi:iron complex outermembrane receptor protein